MPIFMKFDEVKGDVTSRHKGGMIVVLQDGSVRTISNSAQGGLAKVGTGTLVLAGGNTYGAGHKFSLARHFDSDGSTYGGMRIAAGDLVGDAPVAVEVSRISAPDARFGFASLVSREAGAVGKARMLFNAAGVFGLTNGLVVSLSRAALSEAARRLGNGNNLKQIGQSIQIRIPSLEFLVSDAGNPKAARFSVVSGRITGIASDPSDVVPTDSFTLNFAKIRYLD